MNRHFIEEPLMRLGEKKTPAQPASPLWQGFRGVPHLEINRETGKMRYNPPEPAPLVKRVRRLAPAPAEPSNTLEFHGASLGELTLTGWPFPSILKEIGRLLDGWMRLQIVPDKACYSYYGISETKAEAILARHIYFGTGFAITAHPNGTFDITTTE